MSPPVLEKDSTNLLVEKQLDSVTTLINLNEYDKALSYLNIIPLLPQKDLRVQQQLLLGKIYFHQGFFDKALIAFEQTLALHGVSEDLVYADIHSWIGSCYLRFMELNKATGHYNQTLAIRKKLLGVKHKKVGYVYNNLAIIADERGLFKKNLVQNISKLLMFIITWVCYIRKWAMIRRLCPIFQKQ